MSTTLFTYVNDKDIEAFLNENTSDNTKISFLGTTKKIVTRGHEYGGEDNVIESIFVNGDRLALTSKTAYIEIPSYSYIASYVSTTYDNIMGVIEDNELVLANALTDLNTRLETVETSYVNGVENTNTGYVIGAISKEGNTIKYAYVGMPSYSYIASYVATTYDNIMGVIAENNSSSTNSLTGLSTRIGIIEAAYVNGVESTNNGYVIGAISKEGNTIKYAYVGMPSYSYIFDNYTSYAYVESAINTINENNLATASSLSSLSYRVDNIEQNMTIGTNYGIAYEMSINVDEFFINNKDLESYILNKISLVNIFNTSSFISFKTPTVSFSTYEWTEPDENDATYASTEMSIKFIDNTSLEKQCLFWTFIHTNRPLFAITSYNGGGYIDTGLTLDMTYTFEAEFAVMDAVMGVAVGAFNSNSNRTTLRALGSSNKLQYAWPGNNDVTYASSNISVRKMFNAVVSREKLVLEQDGITFTYTNPNPSNQATGTAPILILDESTSSGSNYRNAVVKMVKILDSNNVVLKYFKPFKINENVCMIDVNGLSDSEIAQMIKGDNYLSYTDRIYYSANGIPLQEVSEEHYLQYLQTL